MKKLILWEPCEEEMNVVIQALGSKNRSLPNWTYLKMVVCLNRLPAGDSPNIYDEVRVAAHETGVSYSISAHGL